MRAFIAVEIPRDVRDICTRLESELKRTGVKMKLVEPENIHITLKFLGEIDQLTADRICQILENLGFSGTARTTQVGCFPNSQFIRVIWLGVESEDLVRLKKAIDGELEKLGFEPDPDFVPHITLARVKERPNQELKKILGKRINVDFAFDRVILMKSTLTREGPIYEEVC